MKGKVVKPSPEALATEGHQYNFWIPNTDFDRLKAEAARKGNTIAECIRRHIQISQAISAHCTNGDQVVVRQADGTERILLLV